MKRGGGWGVPQLSSLTYKHKNGTTHCSPSTWNLTFRGHGLDDVQKEPSGGFHVSGQEGTAIHEQERSTPQDKGSAWISSLYFALRRWGV